jgi:hypothetical protein
MMKWLPSRHRFALMRLVGFLLSNRRPPVPRPLSPVIYVIDRDQSAIETYGLSIVYFTVTTCYIAALLPPRAFLAAIPLAFIAIQLPICVSGALILPKWRNNEATNSAMLMALIIAASLYFATRPSWVRFVAFAFLALVAANALAAAVMFALRDKVREQERRCAA